MLSLEKRKLTTSKITIQKYKTLWKILCAYAVCISHSICICKIETLLNLLIMSIKLCYDCNFFYFIFFTKMYHLNRINIINMLRTIRWQVLNHSLVFTMRYVIKPLLRTTKWQLRHHFLILVMFVKQAWGYYTIANWK